MSAAAECSVVAVTHVEQLREASAILTREGNALLELSRRLDTRFCKALELLAGCAGCVIVTGVGKAGLIAQKIAATFSSTMRSSAAVSIMPRSFEAMFATS